jgi:quercetin dioxygenase-like cupin family protein
MRASCCGPATAARVDEAACCGAGETAGKGRCATSASPLMQKASLRGAVAQAHGRAQKRSVTLDGVTVTEVTFSPGARWTQDVAPAAKTATCAAPHVALVLAGALRVRMDDGPEEEFREGDVMLLPGGHDAWTVGEVPCIFVDFSEGYARYGAQEGDERFA